MLARTVRRDLTTTEGIDVAAAVSVSCLDQAVDGVPVVVGGVGRYVSTVDLPHILADASGLREMGEAWGPTRDDQALPFSRSHLAMAA